MTQTKIDFTGMSNKDLVTSYNQMVRHYNLLAHGAVREVSRFADATAGVKRCEKMQEMIMEVESAEGTAQDVDYNGYVIKTVDGAPLAIQVYRPGEMRPIHLTTSLDQAMRFVDAYIKGEAWAVEAVAETLATYDTVKETLDKIETTEGAPATTDEAAAAPAAAEEQQAEGDQDMAKKAKKKAGGARAKSTTGGTIREMTEEYNSIVKGMTKAQKEAAPFAKHHTSNFESKEKAKTQLARLRKAIAKA